MAGQIPNQSGSQLPGLTQPNRNAIPQTPNLGGVPRSTINMDPEFLRARAIMQEKIYDILLQRQQRPVTEVHKRRFKDFAKRLEEAMLATATSQEAYLNLETLESRLLNCIRRPSMNHQNQQYPQHVSPSPIGTMIPRPGMPHVVNSNLAATSSVDASMIVTPGYSSMASPSVNSGSMFPTGGLRGNSLSRSDGLSNGYQPSSSSFPIGSGGTMSSMDAQRIASQIRTLRITDSNNSYMNVESSDNNSNEEGSA